MTYKLGDIYHSKPYQIIIDVDSADIGLDGLPVDEKVDRIQK